ncbi:MAG: ABC transporter permease [Candidatus Pacebacteria bacterium]|nr:ABC transporter permease [Candidatus Paceibacterota bacterium]
MSRIKALLYSIFDNNWSHFLLAMTEKEIRVRYKYALLGFLWIIINPLLQMAIIGFVFQFFIPVNIDNYFLFLFTGLLPWNFFAMSIQKTTPILVHERSLIKKSEFPKEVIVFSVILSNLFHLLISLGLLAILLIVDKLFFQDFSVLETIYYSIRMLLALPILIMFSFFVSGLSLFTSALNVKYRDIAFIVSALTPVLFYATPVVYTLDLLPESLHLLFYLNPLTFFIEALRAIFLNTQITSIPLSMLSLITASLIVLIGYRVFKHESPYFDDWI